MRRRTRLRTPFARPAATATVRARTVISTSASTGPVIGKSRGKTSEKGGAYGETLIHVPSRASTRRPALTRRSTIRAAASEDTCSELSMSRIVRTGTPLCTISSITERTTSARRAVSRRSRSTDPPTFSMSGPFLRATGHDDGRARSGLAGDDLLEQGGDAQGEEVDGLVHLPEGVIGLSPVPYSPSPRMSRGLYSSVSVGGSVQDARTLASLSTDSDLTLPKTHACQIPIQGWTHFASETTPLLPLERACPRATG